MTSPAGRLRACFERQDFAALHELYAEDAVLEVHVGAAHDVHRGRAAVVERYAEDFAAPASFLQWTVREAPWGAVVEAAAVQGGSRSFRWVHLLGVENGRISTDTVYCTGAVDAAAAAR